MGERPIPPDGGSIEPVGLKAALEERYLAYALSTIMHRALPDARDGLKPVHRRILYGMRLLRLDPGTAFKKSAKIVGDVMGTFHPHGDQAIYDALVRLAQDFSQRYPLVDGQGNFGNIDGDNAAAHRYTEARMTEVARLMLDGIDEDAVAFRPNYDGQSEEPVVLPAAFPNLLANGSTGIAVGMATSIPPHNAAELIDACLHLIDNRSATTDDLMRFVKGRTSRPAASSSTARTRSPTPMRPGAAASGCGRAGTRRRPAAAPMSSSSPKSPMACRSRASSRRSPSCSTRRSWRCWPTCATNPPRMCAWCWSRGRAMSMPS